MKDLKTTTFTTEAKILTTQVVKKEAVASILTNKEDLRGLRAMLPDKKQIDDNSDILFFTANLAVANLINLNGDGVLTDGMIQLAKTIKYKPINVEHSRADGAIGCIISAGFSTFGTNELISEEDAAKMEGPFNLVITGAIWKIMAGDVWSIIEESSQEYSPHYQAVSCSWEIGFDDFALSNTKEFTAASIIYGEKAKNCAKYFKTEGGKGVDENGVPQYRVVLNPLGLGLGMVTDPAAPVKGIVTDESFSEMETPETEQEDPEEIETPEEPEDEEEKTKVKVEIEIEVEAADNKGKTLNKPFRLPSGSNKKFGVYVKNDKGNVVMVKFGDPNMEIKRDDPERRKSYRARHSCDSAPGPKWKANYWSCRMWSSKPVSSIASILDFEEWDGETEFNHAEILSFCPEYADEEVIGEPFIGENESEEKNIKKDEKIISTFATAPVIKSVTTMKFENIDQIYASLESLASSDISAKEMREFLVNEFSKANEQYLASQAAKVDAENKLQETLAEATKSKVELDNLKAEVNEMKSAAAAKEAQDTFDKRFGALAEKYDLTDEKVSAFVAKSIKDLDEEGFAHWKDNDGLVVLASREKKKAAANIEDATEAMKEAKANIDIPNSQELEKKEESFLSLANEISFKLKK